MKRFYRWGLVLLVLLFFVPSNALAIGAEVAIGGWGQYPSGDLAYKGASLDVKDELKYDNKIMLFGRAKIDMPLIIPNIYLMASPVRLEGDGMKNVNFTFGDKTFSGNVPFTSKLKLDHYDVALFYGIPFLKTATLGKFNAEAGLNVRIFDLKAEINQPATGINESKNLTVPVPMLYLGAQFNPIKLLSVEAEARAIAYSSNHYFDIICRLKVKPIGPVFIAGGVRYEKLKIDYSDVRADIALAGPFLEVGVSF